MTTYIVKEDGKNGTVEIFDDRVERPPLFCTQVQTGLSGKLKTVRRWFVSSTQSSIPAPRKSALRRG